MGDTSDEALMQAVREGHVDSLGVLFERYYARIHAVCFRLARSADAADDLAQETFLRVLRYRDSFREESAFSTWLFRLACNVCHDHWRRTRRDQPVDEAQLVLVTTPASALDERHVLLDEAMARLGEEQREVLVLGRYHDMTYDEIGRVLECTPAAARVRAHRALKELRGIYRELEQRQYELRSGTRGDRR